MYYRKELKIELSFEKITASRAEIKKEIAKQFGSNEECVIIKKIHNKYGKQLAHLDAFVYDNSDHAKKIESKSVLLRHMTKEEKEKAKEARKAAKQAKKSPPSK